MTCVVVTGANRGIGLELARQFCERGDEVIAVCRVASPELTSLGCEIHEGVDVADDGSVARFAERHSRKCSVT